MSFSWMPHCFRFFETKSRNQDHAAADLANDSSLSEYHVFGDMTRLQLLSTLSCRAKKAVILLAVFVRFQRSLNACLSSAHRWGIPLASKSPEFWSTFWTCVGVCLRLGLCSASDFTFPCRSSMNFESGTQCSIPFNKRFPSEHSPAS